MDTLVQMIDRFGQLESELKKVEALIAERDALRKQLSEACDAVAEGEAVLQGKAYSVVFSKAPALRTIEPNRFAEYLAIVGLDGFLASCKVSTSAADKLLSEQDKARLYHVTKGSRRLKACVPVVARQSEVTSASDFYSSRLASILESAFPAGQGTH